MCLSNIFNLIKKQSAISDSDIDSSLEIMGNIESSIEAQVSEPEIEEITQKDESEEDTVYSAPINAHRNVIVILDCGHGKLTSGKKSPYSMYKVEPAIEFEEWDWNRKFGKVLADKLIADDYIVKYTVDLKDTTDYSLTTRYTNANKIVAANPGKHCIFISIHANAAGSGKEWKNAKGYSVYTTKGQNNSDIFAEYLCDAALEVLPTYGRTVRTDKTDGDKDYEANFTVIYGSKCPAVLIEHGFYDNADECQWLNSKQGMDVLGEVDLQGINNFTKYKWNC